MVLDLLTNKLMTLKQDLIIVPTDTYNFQQFFLEFGPLYAKQPVIILCSFLFFQPCHYLPLKLKFETKMICIETRLSSSRY